MERLHEIGEAIGEMRLQSSAAWMIGRIHTVMGEGQAAIAAAQRGVALATDPVALATATVWLGAAHLENADGGEAIRFLEDAIGQLERLRGSGGYRGRQMDGLLAALLSEAYLTKGEVARAHALATSAHATAVAGGFSVAVGYAERAMALVAMARGERDEGETGLRRTIQTFASVVRALPGGALAAGAGRGARGPRRPRRGARRALPRARCVPRDAGSPPGGAHGAAGRHDRRQLEAP